MIEKVTIEEILRSDDVDTEDENNTALDILREGEGEGESDNDDTSGSFKRRTVDEETELALGIMSSSRAREAKSNLVFANSRNGHNMNMNTNTKAFASMRADKRKKTFEERTCLTPVLSSVTTLCYGEYSPAYAISSGAVANPTTTLKSGGKSMKSSSSRSRSRGRSRSPQRTSPPESPPQSPSPPRTRSPPSGKKGNNNNSSQNSKKVSLSLSLSLNEGKKGKGGKSQLHKGEAVLNPFSKHSAESASSIFDLLEGVEVLTQCAQSLLKHDLVHREIADSIISQCDFMRRSGRVFDLKPSEESFDFEKKLHRLCFSLLEDAFKEAPRRLLLKNRRFLLSAVILDSMALVGVIQHCSRGSGWDWANYFGDTVEPWQAITELNSDDMEEVSAAVRDSIDSIDWDMNYMAISLCLCVCHGFYTEGSYRVVHWRANACLLLSYPTISLDS